MQRKTARAVFAAVSVTVAVGIAASAKKREPFDPEFERLFTKERVEAVVSGITPTTGKAILQKEIRPLLVEKTIVRWDTPAAIADKASLTLDELLSVNRLFDPTSFWGAAKSGRIVIHAGDKYLVPSDPAAVRPFFSKASRVERSERVADAISKGTDVRGIRRISGEKFFPKEPECLGLGSVLSAMLEMQKREFDPLLPVIVDPRIETSASCANLIKYSFIQSCNLKYYTEEQRKMLLTQDLHAWILVEKLRDEFGYVQSHASLMDAFSMKDFQSFNPIVDPKKREKYDEEIMEVYKYLRSEAPQGTIVPMYFQGSQSKPAVAANYKKKDPHLNTHQTMFAGNIDWNLRASDVPVVKDGKREPFGSDSDRLSREIEDLEADLSTLGKRVMDAREVILQSINPIRNPKLVPHLDSVPKLLTNAFKDPKFDRFLKNLPTLTRVTLPKSAFVDGNLDKEKFVEHVKESIRSKIVEGTLTFEGLQESVPWYKIPEGDRPLFEGRLFHAKTLARKRAELAESLDKEGFVDMGVFGNTLSSNETVTNAVEDFLTLKSEIASKKELLKKHREALSAPSDVSRTAVDFLIDFISSRADFPSSFRPGFRQTVLNGLSRYPDAVEMEVNGVKIDVRAELDAYKIKKQTNSVPSSPKTPRVSFVKPSDKIRFTGPMMLDGEMQSTHDDVERQKRMNARTRFIWEFMTTIYLPTEVITPGEGILPAREDFARPEAGLETKYVYSLRMGETLAQVLKARIERYEGIAASDPKRMAKIYYHYKWQILGLKMDGFLQTESEFNVGAVDGNRILPYYDPKVVQPVWEAYLKERKTAELEFERMASPSYMAIATIDGAGIDSKRKLFREILNRVDASDSRLSKYPSLRSISSFNELQYELFMSRFFERSTNDAKAGASKDFFRDIRPNLTFYIRYDELAEIAAEIDDVTSLAAPELKSVDEAVIALVFKNRHNASIAKNVLATETYDVDGRYGIRKTIKKVRELLPVFRNRSHGDFQIRIAELKGSYAKGGRIYRTERSKTGEGIPVIAEWPSLRSIREAVANVYRPETVEIAKRELSGSALTRFEADVRKLQLYRATIEQDDISQEEMKDIHDLLVELMRIDTGDGAYLVGKILSATLLESKIALHFRKTSYWLEKMEVKTDAIADSNEERGKLERTIALVNNLSEDKVLMAIVENYLVRILNGALGSDIETEDVYARHDGNPVKKAYQTAARQLDYDRPKFLEHFRTYLDRAKFVNERDRYLLTKKDAAVDMKKFRAREAAVATLSKYLATLEKTSNFNEELFSLLRENTFRELLVGQKLPWTPFPSPEEFRSGEFQKSVFNYVEKMERRVEKSEKRKVQATETKSGSVSDRVADLISGASGKTAKIETISTQLPYSSN